MTAFIGFLAFLVVTLAFLGGAVVTGLRARRSLHIPLVVGAIAALLTTIYFAERLGESFDLEAAGSIYPVHIALAKTTTLLYLAPVVSGIATIRNARFRRLHFRIAVAVLLLTVATAVTGTWMVLAAEPL